MKRKLGLGLLIILTVFLFINCTSSLKFKVSVLSKNKMFKKSDLNGKSIAVFPLLYGTGVKYSANGFDKIVRYYTTKSKGNIIEIPGALSYKKKVVAGILKEKLDYAYQIMFHKYKSLKVIDKKSLLAIGKKLGFNYIFIFEGLSEYLKNDGYNFLYKRRSLIYKVKIKFHIFDVSAQEFVYSLKSIGEYKFYARKRQYNNVSRRKIADAYDIAVEGAMSSLNKL
ncbi:MAG: hypothetical protein KAS64_04465 [Spirochaetes bacterium]|nr:hypothetical protein [Spirochaetota bacterium]